MRRVRLHGRAAAKLPVLLLLVSKPVPRAYVVQTPASESVPKTKSKGKPRAKANVHARHKGAELRPRLCVSLLVHGAGADHFLCDPQVAGLKISQYFHPHLWWHLFSSLAGHYALQVLLAANPSLLSRIFARLGVARFISGLMLIVLFCFSGA